MSKGLKIWTLEEDSNCGTEPYDHKNWLREQRDSNKYREGSIPWSPTFTNGL